MFTGLIETVGRVRSTTRSGDSLRLSVEAPFPLPDDALAIGDSVAVNGACLTVSGLFAGGFFADVMGVTARKTLIASLRTGEPVNLERALKVGSRLGGHFVTGHVDGVGRVGGSRRDGIAILLSVRHDESLSRYIVSTGSVAVNGASLTVCDARAREFTVSLVPHTASNTTLPGLRAGDAVNLECDILAKYAKERPR